MAYVQPSWSSIDLTSASSGYVQPAWSSVNLSGEEPAPALEFVVHRVVASGELSCVLAGPAEVIAWGNTADVVPPPELSGLVSIAATGSAICALKNDGTVICWGSDSAGQTSVPAELAGVVDIVGGGAHFVACKADGTVVAWGLNGNGQSSVPAGLSDVVSVGAGTYHSLAIKSDGTVVAWGNNSYYQASVPSGLSGVVAVSGGLRHSLALLSDGTVVGWGGTTNQEHNPPPEVVDAVQIAAGGLFSVVGLSDGSVISWGIESYGTVPAPANTTGAIELSATNQHALALFADGSVVAWGDNSNGQIDVPPELAPVEPNNAVLAASLEFSASLAEVEPSNSAPRWATLDFAARMIGYQDWTAGLSPVQTQTVYTLTVTGAADGVPDVVIPISSWQATNQADDRASFVQAVIPAALDRLDELTARQNGELVIKKGYRFADGSARYEEILRSNFDTFRYDRGPTSLTATVSGYYRREERRAGSRQLAGVRSLSMTGGKRRVRCDIDLFLQPGMTVEASGEVFEADYINYYVNEGESFCEVAER